MCDFRVYVGKQANNTEMGLGSNVVAELTWAIVGNSYTIYCDNFFTIVKLLTNLYKDSIYTCETIHSNWVGHPMGVNRFLKKGLKEMSSQRQAGSLLFSLWQDNKAVSVLSTNCQQGEGTTQRRQKDGSKKSFPSPFNIIGYNRYMGGIDDHNDQLCNIIVFA